MIDTRALAEALQENRDDVPAICWSALGRVTDDDPTFVFNDEESSGMVVSCLVLTGPFGGATVPAMISSPVGAGVVLKPMKPKTRVLLHFLEGTVDGLIVLGATVPGGTETPLPTAVAGVKMDEDGLAKNEIHAPGKGVTVRWYIQGAPFLIRLKGAEKDFAGELYIEADDAANSPDGKNGTFIRLVRDASGSFGIKLRTAEGAYVNALKDAVSMADPSGANTISCSSDGVQIYGTKVMIQADLLTMNGGVTQINVPVGTLAPALVAMSALKGPGGAPGAFVGTASTTVFIGA